MKNFVFIALIVIGVFGLYAYLSTFNEKPYKYSNPPSSTTSPSKSNSVPAGVSSACFCQDALTGGSIFSPTATQVAKCRRMYICWQNAQADCMLGSSNVWTSCEMR